MELPKEFGKTAGETAYGIPDGTPRRIPGKSSRETADGTSRRIPGVILRGVPDGTPRGILGRAPRKILVKPLEEFSGRTPA